MSILRKGLLEAISDLNKNVYEMSDLVIKQINDSLYAFEKNNSKLATEIIKKDDHIDLMEEEISKKALKIIWKEQPLAKDLRLVTGILKLTTDLERIGDHATDIAEITLHTADIKEKRLMPLTIKMSEISKKMVFNSIEALINLDLELANKVIETDDLVDKLFKEIIEKLTNELKKENNDPNFLVYLLMVAKYIERIGDHAVNIAEWIIFIVSGIHKETSLF